MAVSPDGSHLYAAGNNDNAVAVFSRNAPVVALTFVEMQQDGVGGVDGLALATLVAVSPDGKHLYAASLNDNAVAIFSTIPAALSLTKTASFTAPLPGQVLTYTLIAANTGGVATSGVVISDTLPSGLSLAGPISLEGDSGGTTGVPPTLVSGVTLSAAQRITVTFPVTVSSSLSGGTVITNTAAVSSTDITTPVETTAVITLSTAYDTLFLPLILK